MIRPIKFPTLLAAILSCTGAIATPLVVAQDLVPRDNQYNLNCSNAPGIVAGTQFTIDNTVLSTSLPESGSNQKWLKYLWCTPNTQTYTFFDFGLANPYPHQYYSFYNAFNQASLQAKDHITGWGDGGLVLGSWFLRTNNTGVYLHVQDSKGKMTWGILESALMGLADMSLNYNKGNFPLVFQINDGVHGEVGIGVAGMDEGVSDDQYVNLPCWYEIDGGTKRSCDDVINGKVIH